MFLSKSFISLSYSLSLSKDLSKSFFQSINKQSIIKLVAIGLPLFLFSNAAYAASLQQMLANLRTILYPATVLVLITCFVSGMFFIFKSLMLFKKTAGAITQMNTPEGIGGPLLYLVIGTVLLNIPFTTNILMNSIFGTSQSIFGSSINYSALGQGADILSYTSGGGSVNAQWADIANTLFLFIQLFGFIYFIKGWYLLAKLHGSGAQQGNLAKGFTHIIGGIILLNFPYVVQLLGNTVLGTG